MKVLFGFEDAHAEEKGTGGVDALRGGEGTCCEVFDAIIDDLKRFAGEVEVLQGVGLGVLGDEGYGGGGVAFGLEATEVALAFGTFFFVEEVEVVDGEESRGGVCGTKGGELMYGVPKVVLRKEERKRAKEGLCFDVGDLGAEGTEVAAGDEEGDVDAGDVGGELGEDIGCPAAVVEGYLAEPAVGMAQHAEVDEEFCRHGFVAVLRGGEGGYWFCMRWSITLRPSWMTCMDQ